MVKTSEKHLLSYKDDLSVERYVNYKAREILWSFKKGSRPLLTYRKALDREKRKSSITELYDKKGNVRRLFSRGEKLLIEFKSNNKEYKKQIFPDKSIELSCINSGIEEYNLILSSSGEGKKIEKDKEKNIKEISWTPGKEVIYLEEKLKNNNSNKTYLYKNGVIRKISLYSDDTSSDIIKLPNNIIKKNIYLFQWNKRSNYTVSRR